MLEAEDDEVRGMLDISRSVLRLGFGGCGRSVGDGDDQNRRENRLGEEGLEGIGSGGVWVIEGEDEAFG